MFPTVNRAYGELVSQVQRSAVIGQLVLVCCGSLSLLIVLVHFGV